MILLRLGCLLAAATLAGCGGYWGEGGSRSPEPQRNVSDLELTESGRLTPSVRISANFVREPDTAPSHAQGGHGIELAMTRIAGNGTQSLAAGDRPVMFGSRSFAGPQELRHEFDFALLDLSYRWRHYFGQSRAFGIELLGGIGAAKFDFSTASATQSARESFDSTGLTLGAGLVWRLRSSTSVQSRLALFGPIRTAGATAVRFEVFAAQALGRNVALRGGWASWFISTDKDNVNLSEVEVTFNGPALGLDLAF